MSYVRWAEAHQAGRTRRITYTMGPEARLRDMVVQTLKKETTDKITLWANNNDDDIWSELFTHPLRQSQIKLVTVRDAHKIKNWQPLDDWLREMRTVKTIMEADKPLFSVPMARGQKVCVRGHSSKVNIKTYSNGREKITCAECDSAETILSKRGRLILCAPPRTEATKRDAITLICNISTASRKQAENLLFITNWRLDAAIEIVHKLNLINAPMTEEIILALGVTVDETKYEQALREGNRAKAATLASTIPYSEIINVLDRMEDWLAKTVRVVRAQQAGATTSEIAIAINCDWGYTIKLCEWAIRLDISMLNRYTIALANAYRESAKQNLGVLEVLALQWK